MFKLIAKNGPERGKDLAQNRLPLTIGRAEDNTIVINDEAASRYHAKISQSAEGLIVEDLGSSNGTFIDGQQIKRMLVKDGQQLQIGAQIFQIISSSNDPATASKQQKKSAAKEKAPKNSNRLVLYLTTAILLLLLFFFWSSGKKEKKVVKQQQPVSQQQRDSSTVNKQQKIVNYRTKRKAKRAFSKGLFQAQINDLPGALKYFRQAWRLNPNYEPARLKIDQLNKQLKAAIEKHLLRGDREFKRLQFDFAIIQYQRALSLARGFDPNLVKKARAKINQARGKKKELEIIDADN